MTESTTVNSARELLDLGVEIESVRFYRLSATANDEVNPEDLDTDVQPVYGMMNRHEGRELGFRMTVRLDHPVGRVDVDVAVEYSVAADVEIPEAVRLEFANEVAVMALVPYVRQAVADMSQRVFGTPLLMPVLQRGELTFAPSGKP